MVENMALPLPDKPSIAVLAFENLSTDADDELLADSFSEDILTALSKLSGLFVIGRSKDVERRARRPLGERARPIVYRWCRCQSSEFGFTSSTVTASGLPFRMT